MSEQPLSDKNSLAAASQASARLELGLAIAVPLGLSFVFVALSPLSPVSWATSFFGQLSGEFLYCNTAVLWFAWRVGGEVRNRAHMGRRFWIASLVIFVITGMLYAHAASGNLCDLSAMGCDQASLDHILSRYFSYYLAYVALTYGLIFAGAKRRGVV